MISDEEKRWNSYFYEKEKVLKNKLNIHDSKELKKVEYEIVAKKNVLLCLSDEYRKFDINHLKFIHRFLFEDIYFFAGEFRTVNMGKDEKASFVDYNDIEINLNYILDNLDLKLINKASLLCVLALISFL